MESLKAPEWLKDCRRNYSGFWHIHSRLSFLHSALMIPIFGMSSYLGIAGIAQSTDPVTSGVLGMIITLFVSLSQYYRFNERAEACSVISKSFMSILKEYATLAVDKNGELDEQAMMKLKYKFLNVSSQAEQLPIDVVNSVDSWIVRKYGESILGKATGHISPQVKRNIKRKERLIMNNPGTSSESSSEDDDSDIEMGTRHTKSSPRSPVIKGIKKAVTLAKATESRKSAAAEAQEVKKSPARSGSINGKKKSPEKKKLTR